MPTDLLNFLFTSVGISGVFIWIWYDTRKTLREEIKQKELKADLIREDKDQQIRKLNEQLVGLVKENIQAMNDNSRSNEKLTDAIDNQNTITEKILEAFSKGR